jgi:MYXO-CTERM domain-containing protein
MHRERQERIVGATRGAHVARHHRRRLIGTTALGLLCAVAASSAGAQISDPAGDFLPTYIGPRNPVANGDLDVLTAGFSFDGSVYRFTSTSAANIGSTPGGFFVWGVNRGAGTQGFPTIAPGVLFDMVIVVNPGGVSTVRQLNTGIATTLAPSAVSFLGTSLVIDVASALIPSTGFAPTAFTANLWPRGFAGGDNAISDFAPDNSNITVTVTPEPSTMLLALSGLSALALGRRRNRRD